MRANWRSLFLITAIFALATGALAHGDKTHIMGTLTEVSTQSLMVRTADGKSVRVKLTADTAYVTKDNMPAKFSDLKPGQRVVVHATPKGSELIANQVKFSPALTPASQ
jgi:hypothetical protein